MPSDIAAAAQAVFLAPASSTAATATTGSNEHHNTNNSTLSNSAKKRNRKLKRKNNANSQGGSAGPARSGTEANTAMPNNQAGSSSDQKQASKRKNNNNAHPGKSRKRSKFDPQEIARNLDAQPELVGVSKDDDFSELLIQHVTHTNKMLQRDLQEQSRKMLAEQKRQAELLAAQVAGLADPSDNAVVPSTTPAPKQDLQKQQHGLQNNSNQKSTHQNRNGQGGNNNNGQPHQKRQQTPFVPKKDCAVCTFKHDIEAQQAAMAAKEADSVIKREASRKARGVCNFEKVGSCAKGDMCPYSHDLSEEPCTYYHLRGICERGDLCRFGHTPISPERLRKLREDLDVKLREKSEMQAMANANFIASANVNSNANVHANANANAYGAGVTQPAFQMGVVSHGTQGLAPLDPQGYIPGHPQPDAHGYTPEHTQLNPQGYIQHGP
ncbi:hypothetical protein BGZ97_010741 [Linnemannia gamsii]|uniref:C3H1-type domain-containing protein n=1 Tax=Linnemannia gamsii TaxID=64522 RepID=A0A9P6UNM6_9FUNG|nr:hypothetical protein BGZ97_010741 [Linnemannia gamsii]